MKKYFIISFYILFTLGIKSVNAQIADWSVSQSGHNVRDIVFDKTGNAWVATNSMGLWNITTGEYFTPNNSDMPDYRINALHIDADGMIWCATHNKGLVKFDGTQFHNYKINNLGNTEWDRMWSVCSDSKNRIWVGVDQHDLYSFDGQTWTAYVNTNIPVDIFPGSHTIFKDKNAKLWIAGSYLYSLEGDDWTGLKSPHGSFTSAAFDSKGNIWGGLWGSTDPARGGVTFYDNSNWIQYHPSTSQIPSAYIKTIAVDNFDQVWVGSFEHGIGIFNGHSGVVYNRDNSKLSHNKINKIVIGPDDKIYICTESGLNIITTGNILSAKDAKLPGEFLLSQNFPNPFNPETMINYQLNAAGYISLKIYDVLGNELASLINEYKQAGNYNYRLTTRNLQLTSGVYFYRLSADKRSETRKMILLK